MTKKLSILKIQYAVLTIQHKNIVVKLFRCNGRVGIASRQSDHGFKLAFIAGSFDMLIKKSLLLGVFLFASHFIKRIYRLPCQLSDSMFLIQLPNFSVPQIPASEMPAIADHMTMLFDKNLGV